MTQKRIHLEKVASPLRPKQADKLPGEPKKTEGKKYSPVNSTKSGCNSTKQQVRPGERNMQITYPTILYLTIN